MGFERRGRRPGFGLASVVILASAALAVA